MSRWTRRHRIALALVAAALLPAMFGTALSSVPEEPPEMLRAQMVDEVWDPEIEVPWPHRFVLRNSPVGIPLQMLLLSGAMVLSAAILTTVLLYLLAWRGIPRESPLALVIAGVTTVAGLAAAMLIATPPRSAHDPDRPGDDLRGLPGTGHRLAGPAEPPHASSRFLTSSLHPPRRERQRSVAVARLTRKGHDSAAGAQRPTAAIEPT